MIKVLFVCLGNICRSPLAEAIFKDIVERENLSDNFEIDSAGTGGWHVGEMPDQRTFDVAERNDLILTNPARQINKSDLKVYDFIILMDEENLMHVAQMDDELANGKSKLHLMRDFDPEVKTEKDVPDPYWGDSEQFDEVFDILKRSCENLLEYFRKEYSF